MKRGEEGGLKKFLRTCTKKENYATHLEGRWQTMAKCDLSVTPVAWHWDDTTMHVTMGGSVAGEFGGQGVRCSEESQLWPCFSRRQRLHCPGSLAPTREEHSEDV